MQQPLEKMGSPAGSGAVWAQNSPIFGGVEESPPVPKPYVGELVLENLNTEIHVAEELSKALDSRLSPITDDTTQEPADEKEPAPNYPTYFGQLFAAVSRLKRTNAALQHLLERIQL